MLDEDIKGKVLKCVHIEKGKAEKYHVGAFDARTGKIQAAMPVAQGSREAYCVKYFNLKDVQLVVEEF